MAGDHHKLNDLDPEFKSKVLKIIKELEADGYSLRVVWGRRTQEENDKLVKKGMASKTSKHLHGKGVDLINRKIGYSTKKDEPYYKKLEELAAKYGLIWGGNFSSRWDPNHLEASN